MITVACYSQINISAIYRTTVRNKTYFFVLCLVKHQNSEYPLVPGVLGRERPSLILMPCLIVTREFDGA